MAQRRLNKKLVAFLTVAGMLLAVVVVTIAAFNASRRDPAVIAEKARAAEARGDLEDAKLKYRQAFEVGRDARYLIAAARCAYEQGEALETFGLLQRAYSQSPRDPQVLNALLERSWEMWLPRTRESLDYAANLLEQQPDHVLALVWKAEVLYALSEQEPAKKPEADEALRRAAELDPTSQYVAVAQARRLLRQTYDALVAEAARAGRAIDPAALLQEAGRRTSQQRVETLRPAVEAHPDDVALRTQLAQALEDGGDGPAAREVLKAGLARQPEEADLHYTIARFALQEAEQQAREAARQVTGAGQPPAADARARSEESYRAAIDAALVELGLEHANRAIELDKAYYEAYTVRAHLWQLKSVKDGTWSADPRACQRQILDAFVSALNDTVGLKTRRARLGVRARLDMLLAAFEMARHYFLTSGDEAIRAQSRTYLRQFQQRARIEAPEDGRTALMTGYLEALDGDRRLAVNAFLEAEKTENFRETARSELVRLYRELGETGLSLRYTDAMLEACRREQRTPPPWLYANKAELLLLLDRKQEALDLLDSIATLYPDDPTLNTVRARTLALLGRAAEGAALLTGDDPRSLFFQAAIAENEQNYERAAELYRRLLELDPNNVGLLRRLVGTLNLAGRSAEALALIDERLAQTADEGQRRTLLSYRVLLSTTDPQERERQLLDLIADNPDPYERAAEYYNFWFQRGDLEQAARYLDEMARLRPDDLQVLQRQFDLALQRGDCEQAGRHCAALANLNADQVGGATFRGQYELRCGSPDKALREFRTAERTFPTDSWLKTLVARALLLLTPPRYDEAIRTLEQALEADPRSFVAHSLLFSCYMQQPGGRERAAHHLEQAARLRPDDPFVKTNRELLEEEQHPQAGIERREKLRAAAPTDIANLLRLAELYARVDDSTRAEECLLAAAQVDPADRRVAAFAASFYGRRGDRAAGERLLRQFLDRQQGMGEIEGRVLLGRFYEQLGDADSALSAYQQAQARVAEVFAAGSADRNRAMVAAASELAEFYRRMQRHVDVVSAYRVVLTHLDPADTAGAQFARQQIIQGLVALGQWGQAGEEIARYRKDYPDDAAGMMLEAQLRRTEGHLDQAHALLTSVLDTDPQTAWPWFVRGQINIERGNYEQARTDLIRAKELAPEGFNLRHRLELARLYQLTGRPELAEAELRELLPLKRSTRDVELALILVLANSRQLDKAQALVNELRAREPGEPFWPYQLGRLLAQRGEFSAAARPLQDAALLASGQDLGSAAFENEQQRQFFQIVVADWLAALVGANRADEATQVYERLNPAVLTPRIKAHAAEAYQRRGQPEVATALLEQALADGSARGVTEVQYVLHYARRVLGSDAALNLARQVLAQSSDALAALTLRDTLAGYLASRKESAAEALEMADAVIAGAQPQSPLRLHALLARALALSVLERYDEAIQTYEEAIRLAPDSTQALNNFAYLLAELNRAAEALRYAERLRELAPDEVNVLDTVGWIYFKNGRLAQAEAVLKDALRIDPDSLAARYHLAHVYAAQASRRAEAQVEFRRLMDRARELRNAEYEQKAEEALQELR